MDDDELVDLVHREIEDRSIESDHRQAVRQSPESIAAWVTAASGRQDGQQRRQHGATLGSRRPTPASPQGPSPRSALCSQTYVRRERDVVDRQAPATSHFYNPGEPSLLGSNIQPSPPAGELRLSVGKIRQMDDGARTFGRRIIGLSDSRGLPWLTRAGFPGGVR